VTTDPNLRVQIDHESKHIDIRQSAIQSFLNCPRRFYYEYVLGIEPDYPNRQRPWATVDTGTLFHEMIGAHYLGADPVLAADAYITEQGFHALDPEVAKARELVEVMVYGHIDDIAQDGADVGETTVGVEVPVTGTVKDVNGWTVNIHGRVDRLIETDDGIKIIDDWKTVGPLGSSLGHIQQLGRYAMMLRQEQGWRADRVRTTQVRKVKRTKPGPYYARPWVPLNEDAYKSHAQQLRAVLTGIVDKVTASVDVEDYVFNVTTECDWKCRVQDICLAHQYGDDPEMIVDIHYRPKGQEGTE
jgi:RecB family exonuclease